MCCAALCAGLCRHGRLIGFEQPFLWRVVDSVVSLMGQAYPELTERRDYLSEVIRTEEERFSDTLGRGLTLLEQEIGSLRAGSRPPACLGRLPFACTIPTVSRWT